MLCSSYINFRMSMKGVTSPKRVFVVGVGATKFEKPLTKQWDYPDMGREAGRPYVHTLNVHFILLKDIFSRNTSLCDLI